MQPYATASDPSPLNGNRPNVSTTNDSFFNRYRHPILYSLSVIVLILIVLVVVRRRRSFYDVKNKPKTTKKCPTGCVPAPKKVVKKDSKKGTSFDPTLTNKKVK
jgi:hypothetical protein